MKISTFDEGKRIKKNLSPGIDLVLIEVKLDFKTWNEDDFQWKKGAKFRKTTGKLMKTKIHRFVIEI